MERIGAYQTGGCRKTLFIAARACGDRTWEFATSPLARMGLEFLAGNADILLVFGRSRMSQPRSNRQGQPGGFFMQAHPRTEEPVRCPP